MRGERGAHQPAGAGRSGAGGSGRLRGAVRGARGPARLLRPACAGAAARSASPAGGRLRSAPRGCGAMEAVDQVRGAPRGAVQGRGGGRCGAERGADPLSLPAARLRGDFPRGEGAARLPQGARVGESRVGRDGERRSGRGGVAVVVVVVEGSGGCPQGEPRGTGGSRAGMGLPRLRMGTRRPALVGSVGRAGGVVGALYPCAGCKQIFKKRGGKKILVMH